VLLGSMATPAWSAGAGGRAFRGDRQVPLPYFSVGSRLSGAGAALRTRVTMPAATMAAPTTHMPAFWVPVRSASQPAMEGAKNPAELPQELMTARPAAAPAP